MGENNGIMGTWSWENTGWNVTNARNKINQHRIRHQKVFKTKNKTKKPPKKQTTKKYEAANDPRRLKTKQKRKQSLIKSNKNLNLET